MPTRAQWKKLSLTAKLTCIGAYLGAASLLVGIVPWLLPSARDQLTAKTEGHQSPAINVSGASNSVSVIYNVSQATNSQTWNPRFPPFKIASEKLTYILGSGSQAATFRWKRGSGPITKPYANVNGNTPILFRIENDVLSMDLDVFAGDGKSPIIFRDNTLQNKPRLWDCNFNEMAFELVDENGKPAFQYIRKSESELQVNGAFISDGIFILADDRGCLRQFGGQPAQTGLMLKPIFKYPAWKHKGEYAE
jgi:hypothetical protein